MRNSNLSWVEANSYLRMQERVEVAFFHIDGDRLGGGSKMLLKLLKGIDTQQFAPRLILQQKGRVYDEARELDLNVDIVPYKGILDSYDGSLLSKSFHAHIRTAGRILQYNTSTHSIVRQADVIWCANLRVVLTLLPSILISSRPVIWNVGLGLRPEGVVKHLKTVALRFVDHVFIESEAQLSRVFTDVQIERHRNKFATFHKGIDINHFDPNRFEESTSEEFHVGTAALINPRKGLEDFIDAAALVLNERSDVRFTIAGEPARENDLEYKAELERRIAEHGIENHLEFLGWVEDMPAYLHTLDVFVLPSLNEGIPGAIREALAMEVPVVATDVGGTSEVVRDGETGFLVEPENPDSIAEAIGDLLANLDTRVEMGTRGRKLIKSEFSIETYVANYESFLIEITKPQ